MLCCEVSLSIGVEVSCGFDMDNPLSMSITAAVWTCSVPRLASSASDLCLLPRRGDEGLDVCMALRSCTGESLLSSRMGESRFNVTVNWSPSYCWTVLLPFTPNTSVGRRDEAPCADGACGCRLADPTGLQFASLRWIV